MDLSAVQSFLPVAVIFIFSVVIHEVSHGAMALAFGDQTAKNLGRLTLNPIKHIDPFGSVILPLSMWFLSMLSGGQGIIFGWAKPVPYNPDNLSNRRWGQALVGAAGPLANISLALVFGLLLRALPASENVPEQEQQFLGSFFAFIVFVNLWLALFNLIPIPPLDGFKLFSVVLSPSASYMLEMQIARLGPAFLIVAFLLLINVLLPILFAITKILFTLIVG